MRTLLLIGADSTIGQSVAKAFIEGDLPGLSAYATAKAGRDVFAQVLAKENPRWRITVVRPAAVATRFWERVPFRLPPNALNTEIVALRILEAYYNEQKGTLDILPG
jgi:NAD(P)-dependent dehydrogenase (short-subunit alcohol dehydrogenase family)